MNFGSMMKTYNIVLEIHTPAGVQKRQMQAPRMMIEQQFLSLAEQAMSASYPVKIAMRRYEPEWDQYEGKYINMEYSVVYANQSYLTTHEEEFRESQS